MMRGEALPPILISPVKLALIAVFIFFVFTSIPPSIYHSFIDEPDLMFFNLYEYVAFFVFVIIFLLGYGFGLKIKLNHSESREIFIERYFYSNRGHLLLSLILIVQMLTLFYSFKVLSATVPDIYLNFITDNAQRTKLEISDSSLAGTLGQIVPLATGTVWWIVGRWEPIVYNLGGFGKYLFFFLVTIFISALIVDSAILASRWALVPLILGSFFVHYAKHMNANERVRRLNVYFFFSPFLLIAIFLSFSFLRGFSGLQQLSYTLIGYGPASYNRFAAILDGRLNFHTIGVRIDDFGCFLHLPFVERLFNINALLGLQATNTLQTYFTPVAQAGLDSGFIWASMFGQVFADLGILSFIYILFYGVIAAFSWKSIVNGGIFGQLVYPWMAFSIIFWFGDNIFFLQNVQDFVLLAIFVTVFESFFGLRKLELNELRSR